MSVYVCTVCIWMIEVAPLRLADLISDNVCMCLWSSSQYVWACISILALQFLSAGSYDLDAQYMGTCVYVPVYMRACARSLVGMYVCMCASAFTCVSGRTWTCVYVCVRVRVCVCVYF